MDYLKINHFKCFEDATIPLKRLTVMAGANGTGKSTSIQALLYLRETIEHCGEPVRDGYGLSKANGLNVPLNGVYCLALGNSSFVLNKNYNGNILSLGLTNENGQLIVDYEADNRQSKLWLTPHEVHSKGKTDFPILLHQFYYLNAERLGPRVSQSMQFSDFPNAGWQGENTAQLLDLESGYFKIENERRFQKSESNFLKDQVNNWLDFLMKGVRVKVESSPNSLTAQILLENHFTVSDPTLSTNIGFGISYVLPIIVTGLIARKGSLFIVENPEAHLHPSAQSRIGRFLAKIASAGVKVIIETHSDHIINGIQIAIAERAIESSLVVINFFSCNDEQTQPDINTIGIKNNGELTEWPKGFFDQTQVDFAHLFNLRKE